MNARVEELFHRVADLSADARSQYFSAHAVDPDTRREVEALLTFDSGASAFLQRDVTVAARRSLAQLDVTERRCGPYRLLTLIGCGGMGTVYLAERADGEVSQRVAVKLLPPGAGTAHRDRFVQERQILAGLTHANIARMLDAGHLENGQLFLAMEYIDGRPIDVVADGLSLRQRITLFLKVCAAVGYLHRNLVVHRDLKPSNILVTADGEPRLLDFGIAKMLDVATDSTMTSLRMLTPDYASPEQVTGGRISTATDIYSLGAVLYRMLTGHSPHAFEGSTPEAVAATVTAREVTRPSRWSSELKGDLDCVLLKALRKDQQDRYATVEQFAEDLEAFLVSRPVKARAGNAWYRTRKYLRRYWMPAVATAIVLASLASGLYVANRERALAQRRFQDVRQLANKLFDIDVQVRDLAGSTKSRQLIVDTSLDYLRRLRADSRGDSELALELGTAYMRVARVQGVPISANLGQMDRAEQNLQIAEDLIQSVVVSRRSDRTALLRAAQIAHDRMIIARLSGRPDEALAFARKSAEWLEKFHTGPADKPETTAVLTTYLNVADQFRIAQQFDESLRLCGRGTEVARLFNHRLYIADLLWVSAEVFRRKGDLDEALKEIRESVNVLDPGPAAVGEQQGRMMNFVLALIKEGRILGEHDAVNAGRSEEAIESLRRAFEIADGLVHKDSNDQSVRGDLAMAGISLGDILRETDAPGALAVYDHTLRHLNEVQSNRNFQRYEVEILAGSSYPLRRLGNFVEARHRLDRAFARLRAINLYPAKKMEARSEAGKTVAALADLEAGAGNVVRAIEIYQDLLDQLRTGGAKPETRLQDATDFSHIYRMVAALQRRNGRADLASALEARRLDLWRDWEQKLPNNPFVLRQIAAEPAQ
jgi:tetratricopeptide (TPR) repeat protein/predicted Ser/Thr protein kinase